MYLQGKLRNVWDGTMMEVLLLLMNAARKNPACAAVAFVDIRALPHRGSPSLPAYSAIEATTSPYICPLHC